MWSAQKEGEKNLHNYSKTKTPDFAGSRWMGPWKRNGGFYFGGRNFPGFLKETPVHEGNQKRIHIEPWNRGECHGQKKPEIEPAPLGETECQNLAPAVFGGYWGCPSVLLSASAQLPGLLGEFPEQRFGNLGGKHRLLGGQWAGAPLGGNHHLRLWAAGESHQWAGGDPHRGGHCRGHGHPHSSGDGRYRDSGRLR